MPSYTKRGGDLVQPTTSETFSINNPQHRAAAAVRLANWGLQGSKSDLATGKQWYHTAHEIVGENARTHGISMEKAAAVTSILSPGSDWSSRNIGALSQAIGIRPHEWADIKASRFSQQADLERRRAAGTAEKGERVKRHGDIQAMLTERAPLLGGSTDVQLLKSHDVLTGAKTPADVFPRETSPKTKAFYHGLLKPGHMGGQVPIDFRMADIAHNTMRAYKVERDIGYDRTTRAQRAAGQTESTYAAHERLIGEAGRAMAMRGGRQFAGMNQPLKAQAYLWHLGKEQELRHPEAKQSRLNPGQAFTGPKRTGQRYTSESGAAAW